MLHISFTHVSQNFWNGCCPFVRLVSPGTTAFAGKPPDPANPRRGHGSFDTYRFVSELEAHGIQREQAVAIMDQVLLAITEAKTEQIALVSG